MCGDYDGFWRLCIGKRVFDFNVLRSLSQRSIQDQINASKNREQPTFMYLQISLRADTHVTMALRQELWLMTSHHSLLRTRQTKHHPLCDPFIKGS